MTSYINAKLGSTDNTNISSSIGEKTPNLQPTQVNKGSSNGLITKQLSGNITKNLNSGSGKIGNSITTSTPSVTMKLIKEMCHLSRVGYSGEGVKKVNQDIFFVYENFNDNPNHLYLGVCDGHGSLGHLASGYLKQNLPVNMDKDFKKYLIQNIPVKKIIEDVFIDTCHKLNHESNVDTKFR